MAQKTYYLAVDIGASSGRHMLAWLEDGRLQLEEIYRFENGMKPVNGHLCWDVQGLFSSIIAGMKKCSELGRIPVCMGIDTWAVDFVLLDAEGKMIGDAVGYRDGRTAGMDEKVYEIIPEAELYARTGIQKQIFNTIYQLMAVKEQHPEQMEAAKDMLLIPDYLNYLLTGVKKTEYTNASTTQLVSPETKDWDMDLIDRLGYKKELFGEISMAGTTVGGLTDAIRAEVGYDLKVVQVATHDTASAVVSVPVSDLADAEVFAAAAGGPANANLSAAAAGGLADANLSAATAGDLAGANLSAATASDCLGKGEGASRQCPTDFLYISSGTWSLMGTELLKADCSEASQAANMTNEGGYDYRFRYLKNIMGLWMIQSVRHEWNDGYSFAEICEMAEKENDFPSRVDVNDASFLAPKSMIGAVKAYCEKSGQPVPETPGQIATVIYQSLADCYGTTVRELEALTGKTYDRIYVVGGGSNADYLNRLTAAATGKTVSCGPGEATAIGNIAVQMMATGALEGLGKARKCIAESFPLKVFHP